MFCDNGLIKKYLSSIYGVPNLRDSAFVDTLDKKLRCLVDFVTFLSYCLDQSNIEFDIVTKSLRCHVSRVSFLIWLCL